jgi:hypothetical protein
MLNGKTPIDTSDISLALPTGSITTVELVFQTKATMQGSITTNSTAPGASENLLGIGTSNPDPGTPRDPTMAVNTTVYTTTGYDFDPVTQIGGAPPSAITVNTSSSSPSYTSPFNNGQTSATPETVGLCQYSVGYPSSSDSQQATTVIDTPANITLTATSATPTLTILVDLSRMLKFYDGQNPNTIGLPSGTSPNDATTNAYFYTIMDNSNVAAFFGTPGMIQGYQGLYTAYQISDGTSYANSNTTPEFPSSPGNAVRNWMDLVFDPNGNLIAGCSWVDDMADYKIAMGTVSPTSQLSSTVAANLVIGESGSNNITHYWTIPKFILGSSVGDYGYFDWTDTNSVDYGDCQLTLAFTTQ